MNRLPQFLHILNPNAANRTQVRRFFESNPRAPRVWVDRSSHPTHLETILEWALNQGTTKIAVWAGDGSFSRAVHWLWANKSLNRVSLALVPVGTGNDFSRTLGLWPWSKNIARIFSDKAVLSKTDVGLVSGSRGHRIFVNNAGFGRTPEAVSRRRSNPLRDILSLRPKRLQLDWETDGARCTETIRAIMGIIFNAPYFNRGLYFDNTISPSDGKLQAVFLPPSPPVGLLWRFFKGRWGSPLKSPSDFWVEGASIEVESETDLNPQVDGESAFSGADRRLRFTVLKDALTVYI